MAKDKSRLDNTFDRLSSPRGLVILIIMLATIAWLVPVGVRIGAYDSLPVGKESYLSARMSRQIMESGLQGWDRLQDRPMQINPYYIFLSLFIEMFGAPLGYLVSTLFITAFSLLGFAYLLYRLNLPLKVAVLALLIWILSPTYLRLSLVLEPGHLGLVLVLFAVALFIKTPPQSKHWHHIVAAFLLLITYFLSPFNALLGIAVLVVASMALREPLLGFITFLSLPLPLMYYRQLSLIYPLFQPFFAARPYLIELISDFGAPVGFATFALFLAGVALFSMWKKGLPYSATYFPILILATGFLYFPRQFTLYFSAPLALLAALGFLALWEMEWEIDIIRNLSILLIGCGLLFTGLSYLNRTVNSEPFPYQVEAFTELSHQLPGKVFSHPDNGFYIEYFASKQVYLDSLHSWDDLQKQETADTLYWNRNLPTAIELLAEERVRYIFIDNSMKSGKVWRREDEGLLFLLEDHNTFEKLFTLPGGEAWLIKEFPDADSPKPNIVYTTS